MLDPWTAGRRPGSRHPLNGGPGPGRGPYGLGAPLPAASVPVVRSVTLKPTEWTSLTVLAVRDEGGCKAITFGLPNNGTLRIKPSQHVRVRVGAVNEDRPYTPTFWKPGALELLVKPYPAPGGHVSRAICALRPGDEAELRGPLGAWQWEQRRREGRSHLVLCGMGTGLTPLVQLLGAVQELDWSRGKKVRATLLLAHHDEESFLMVKRIRELEALAGGLLTVRRFQSSKGERLSPDAMLDVVGGPDALLDAWVCVCGTDSFADQFRQELVGQDLVDEKSFHAF